MKTLLRVESVTQAVRTKKLLCRYGIRAKLVKTNLSSKGCSYAVQISGKSMLDVASILRSEGIKYSLEVGEYL